MSYQERRSIVTLVFGAVLLVAYTMYASSHGYFAPDAEIVAIARAMLMFVGIGIAAMIIIQILFHILYSIGIAVTEQIKITMADGKKAIDEQVLDRRIKTEFREDERDALVGLKSSRIGYAIVGVGFIAALVSLALDHSAATMLHILIYSWLASSLIEGCVQLYFYRKTN